MVSDISYLKNKILATDRKIKGLEDKKDYLKKQLEISIKKSREYAKDYIKKRGKKNDEKKI